jgi:hypothetical protein
MGYTEEEIYRKAKKKVRAKKGFYSHLGVYFTLFLFFFIMNILNYDGDLWFFYPMLPWGLSIAIHYLSVFGLPGGKMSSKWEEEEMEKEMNRQRRIRGAAPSEPLALPEDELELREFKKLRKEWDDQDFV